MDTPAQAPADFPTYKGLFILVIILVMIVGLAITWLYLDKKEAKLEYQQGNAQEQEEENADIESAVDISSQLKDPSQEIPDTNPFNSASNPLDETYKNPFE